MKVYVIVLELGEYSDYSKNLLKGYMSEVQAQAEVLRLQRQVTIANDLLHKALEIWHAQRHGQQGKEEGWEEFYARKSNSMPTPESLGLILDPVLVEFDSSWAFDNVQLSYQTIELVE